MYSKNTKVYQIVVLRKFRKVSSGSYLEKIGIYSPKLLNSKNKNFVRRIFFVNLDRLSFWLAKGAIVAKKVGFLIAKLELYK